MPEDKSKLTDTILRFLRDTGKPATLNGLIKELPKDKKKPSIEKALDQLVDSQKVVEKTFGKKKLYYIKQTKVDNAKLLEERNALNEKNLVLDRESSAVEQTVKTLEGEVKQQVNKAKQDPDSELSSADIEEQISELQQKVKVLTAEKEKLTANRPKATSKLSKDDYEKEWRKRKRIVRDIMDAVLENSEMTKKELLEKLGIETDEDAGVSLP